MKYSKSPLIHLQMIVSGVTALIFYYPSMWILCSFNPIAATFIFHDIFLKARNPKIPIRKVLKKFFLFLPVFIHPLIYLLSTDYVPPNASFIYTSRMRTTESVDLYVLDRSIITLVNEYNQMYLNGDNAIRGGFKDVASIWRMIKAHIREDDIKNNPIDPIAEYESLFIKNGDTVMLENIGTGLFLGVEKSNKKFTKCTLASESEYWKVFSDTQNVKSRISRIRLQHLSTGRFLSPIDQNFYASTEGIHRGRIFLIEDSRMEDFYREFLPTERVKEKINLYPFVPNYRLALELFFNLISIGTNVFSFLIIKPQKITYKEPNLQINMFIHNFCTTITFLCGILALVNYVFYKKYGKIFYFKKLIPVLSLYFFSLIPQLILGTTLENYSSCSMYAIIITCQLIVEIF